MIAGDIAAGCDFYGFFRKRIYLIFVFCAHNNG